MARLIAEPVSRCCWRRDSKRSPCRPPRSAGTAAADPTRGEGPEDGRRPSWPAPLPANSLDSVGCSHWPSPGDSCRRSCWWRWSQPVVVTKETPAPLSPTTPAKPRPAEPAAPQQNSRPTIITAWGPRRKILMIRSNITLRLSNLTLMMPSFITTAAWPITKRTFSLWQ